MLKRIRSVEFVYHPQVRGWTCVIAFTFTSARQFTDEEQTVQGDCRRWWITAWWSARKAVRAHIALYGAKKSEREKLGWA